MSKERLKQFKNSLDFLDDSADMSDYHRLIDTLENLYKDGELDWIHRYAREQAERVQELEKEKEQDPRQGMLEDLHAENKRYREAIEKALNRIETEISYDQFRYDVEAILLKALEGDPHD